MVIDIDADMRRLYEERCLRAGKEQSVEGWQAFKAGWGEALLYAAQAREAERKWIADGRPE